MKKTYSVAEAAKYLGYSNNSIYGFIKSGEIAASRVGRGKFRISQKEIDRLIINKDTGEGFEDHKKRIVDQPSLTQLNIVPGDLLPNPRPGKSLSDLSGEPPLHTLRLWFEERVGLPTLFDWLISLSSIILGLSLFLYSNQLDILTLGRLSVWSSPIRFTLIFGGMGLIVASMIKGEYGKLSDMTLYFHLILSAAYLGLAAILFSSKDLDGFLIYGLFGVVILIEVFTAIKSSSLYALYIFGLLVSILFVYQFSPDSGISVVTSGLKFVLDGYGWILSLAVVLMIVVGLYGYLWKRSFLKQVTFIYGIFLCVLALYYSTGSYWSRSFSVLLAGMVGMVLPFWETFKIRLQTNRTLVFKLFSLILVSFMIPMLVIAVIQNVLISNTYRELGDKAEFAKVQLSSTIDYLEQGMMDLTTNESFINAVSRKQSSEVLNQLRLLILGRSDVVLVGVIGAKGLPLVTYPSSSTINATNFSESAFFADVYKTGNNYLSSDLESLGVGMENVLLVSVPVIDAKNIVSGVLVAAISGVNMSYDLQRITQQSLGQEVVVIGEGARYIAHPDTTKLGMVVSEVDSSYSLWKYGLEKTEGYNWNGVHSLFRASMMPEYGFCVVVSESIQKVLDISSSWLAWLLFLQFIVGIVVFVSFMFKKQTGLKEVK